MAFDPKLSLVASGAPLACGAAAAIEAVIETGVQRLIAEPWRVSRIIRDAEELTIDQLRGEIARRRNLPPPRDFNRALALAQLARALDRPGFEAAWSTRRAAAARRAPAVIA
jgi:hypothetical protein